MKLSAAIAFSFLSAALAAGPADNVNAVLADINTALKAFDSSIKAWTGGPTDALVKSSGAIESIVNKGAASIAAGADLTLADTLSITSSVTGLQSTLDTTLSDLESVGPKLAAAGQCSTITSQLTSQQAASKRLQDAISDKAPAETKSIATQLGGKVGASIGVTLGKYNTFCANAPKSGGGSPPAGGAAAPPPPKGPAASSVASKAGGPAASTTAPRPALFTNSGNVLATGQNLALGVAAAFLAL